MQERASSVRRRVADIAEKMLSGDLDTISGVRQLNDLRASLPEAEDEIFIIIRSIESDTEDVPTGELRAITAHEYIERMDREMGEFLPKVQPQLDEVLRKLIERYK